jgi:acyl carrier protein
MPDLEKELKELIVTALELEDISPAEIDSDEPLFVDGLGLDSIDGLELGVAIRKKFKIKVQGTKEEIRAIFRTVRTLAQYLEEKEPERSFPRTTLRLYFRDTCKSSLNCQLTR